MVHYLARIIILSVVMFTCVNHNTTLAQEFQDWCVHVDGLESHGLFRKKQDIGRTSLFYRTKIFPNVILRINDNGVTNQFTIYRTNYLNDTTLELKSIGYEELNVEIEKKPLDVTKKRFTVFLNNCEIPGTNYESDSSFFFDFVYYAGGCEIDIDLVRYEIKQNQKETRLNIP